jgi:hypothetical protein
METAPGRLPAYLIADQFNSRRWRTTIADKAPSSRVGQIPTRSLLSPSAKRRSRL